MLEVVLAGCALVTLAVAVRLCLCKGRPPASMLVGLLGESAQVLVAYAAVFRITTSILPAAAAGIVVALSPLPVVDWRAYARSSVTSALHILVLLAMLRVADASAPLRLLDPLMLIAIALIGLLYWVDSRASAMCLVCAAVLSLVSRDLRFVALAVAGIPFALLMGLATHRPDAPLFWRTQFGQSPLDVTRSPAQVLSRLMRLGGQNACLVLLLALPGSQIPWGQLMSWWAASVVGWTLLSMLVRPLRVFGVTWSQVQLAVAPTAFALALSLNEYAGGINPLRPSVANVAAVGCAGLSLVMRALPASKDPAALTVHALSVGSRSVLAVVRARRRLIVAALLFGLAFGIFQADYRYQGSGDTKPAELLPIALMEDHSPTFERFTEVTNDQNYFWGFATVKGRVVSTYPIVPGLVNTPVFVVAAWNRVDLIESEARLSAITAALVSSASVALMFAVLLNLFGSTWTALLGASVYAFGTCVWSVASKAMWQHGPSLLFLLGALALLTRREAPRWLFLAGLLLGLALWNRPTNIVFVAAITLWWMWHTIVPRLDRRRWLHSLPLVVGIALPTLAMLVYSSTYLGRVDTFGQLQTFDTFRGNLPVGFVGLLLSPSRGILVMSPILLLSLLGACIALKRWRTHTLGLALAAAVLVELLIYGKWLKWWGGASFGYRLILETVPALVILAALAWHEWARRRAVWIGIVGVLAVFSVYVQWLGATYYGCGFNVEPNNIDDHPERLWDVTNGEISRCTTKALITNRLLSPGVNGPTSLDRTGLSASLEDIQLPAAIHPDTQIAIDVTARNTGQATWLAEPAGLIGVKGVVGVSVRSWTRSDGVQVPGSENSTVHVPWNVDPGSSARVELATRAPPQAGQYDLVLDVLSEKVSWFQDVNGGARTVIPVRVE